MFGLVIVIIVHFLYSIVALADKFVIEKSIRSPIAYGFFVSLLGAVAFFILPFNFGILHGIEWLYALISGITFTFATVTYFHTLDIGKISRMAPLIGGSVAILTALVGLIFFDKGYSANHIMGIVLLIIGIFFITAVYPHGRKTKKHAHTPQYIIVTALLFAISALSFEELFKTADFIQGFAYTRLVSGVVALLFLLYTPARKAILKEIHRKRTTKKQKFAPFFKVIGAAANILYAYSISLVGAILVNALAGLQYLLIFPLSFIAAKKIPGVYTAVKGTRALVYMTIGIATIVVGIGIIAITS
jgi:uncharacterized membrane protein